MAEKNRRAQKKFREKQKNKMQDSARTIDDLSAKLKAANLENNQLQSRNDLLQKVPHKDVT